jgi:hypothetical protein
MKEVGFHFPWNRSHDLTRRVQYAATDLTCLVTGRSGFALLKGGIKIA